MKRNKRNIIRFNAQLECCNQCRKKIMYIAWHHFSTSNIQTQRQFLKKLCDYPLLATKMEFFIRQKSITSSQSQWRSNHNLKIKNGRVWSIKIETVNFGQLKLCVNQLSKRKQIWVWHSKLSSFYKMTSQSLITTWNMIAQYWKSAA